MKAYKRSWRGNFYGALKTALIGLDLSPIVYRLAVSSPVSQNPKGTQRLQVAREPCLHGSTADGGRRPFTGHIVHLSVT